jgi:hypothetical protein
MGRRGQYIMDRRVDIPWIGVRYTMGRGVRYTMGSGCLYTMGRGPHSMGRVVKIPWVGSSIYHG